MVLTKDGPDEPEVIIEKYFSRGVEADKRCRGDNLVIGEIERAIGEACVFSRLYHGRCCCC